MNPSPLNPIVAGALEDNDMMINVPDGFDARNCSLMQHCSPGTPIESAQNSNSMTRIWFVNQLLEAGSKLCLDLKFSLKEDGIILNCSSTKAICSKLESADQR